MKQYLSVFLFLILFTGCEKIVDFKGKQPPKKLIVSAIFNCDGEEAYLELSESYFIYSDEYPEAPYDTQVRIEINGEECNDIWYLERYDEKIMYGFKALLKAGDVVKVIAESEKHGTVTGEEIVPVAPSILDVRTEPFLAGEYGNKYMRVFIRIKDDPSVNNYYRLLIRESYYDTNYPDEHDWYNLEYNIEQDLVMSSLSSQDIQDGDNNLMRIFPDDLFNGKEYTLNIYLIDPTYYKPEGIDMRVCIEVQALSESLYLYMRSLEMSLNSDIFSEPVRIYSNVKGGYGIVGVYNSSRFILEY